MTNEHEVKIRARAIPTGGSLRLLVTFGHWIKRGKSLMLSLEPYS